MLDPDVAIADWSSMPYEAMAALDPEGDGVKKHLLNPTVFALLERGGALADRRVLDAGAGQGYLARLLAARGARVTAVEPATGLYRYGAAREAELGQGITWVQADLTTTELPATYDAVVASMVLMCIADWQAALATCVRALRPGGQLVFSLSHPCFDPPPRVVDAGSSRVSSADYPTEYAVDGPTATDVHRPLSTYLNGVLALGCRLTAVVEPTLTPHAAADLTLEQARLVRASSVVVVAAERETRSGESQVTRSWTCPPRSEPLARPVEPMHTHPEAVLGRTGEGHLGEAVLGVRRSDVDARVGCPWPTR